MSTRFRTQLAARFAVTLSLAVGAVGVVAYVLLRDALDREIDASLLNVALIQAAATTDAPGGAMELHEWNLTPEEAESVRDLVRYAQVWSESGESLLRSRVLERDLPLDTGALGRAAAGEITWTEQHADGVRLRSLYYPLGRMGALHAPHVLQVAASMEQRDRTLTRVLWFIALVFVVAAAGALIGSMWLAERAVRPVHEITAQAEGIGAGTQPRRIDAYAEHAEYRDLVQVLNAMLGRLDASIEAQRRFTSDASHELRSPLTALRGELEVARRRDRSGEEYRRVLDSALEEVDRLARLVDDLLMLARADAGAAPARPRDARLATVAARVVERLAPSAHEREVELTLDAGSDTTGRFDPDLMERLLWNLVENALRYTPRGGRVAVGAHAHGDELELVVDDTGPGIPADMRTLVFDRFYRADDSRTQGPESGTGLGLSMVRSIARAHAGEATVEEAPGGGARFRVRFPRSTA